MRERIADYGRKESAGAGESGGNGLDGGGTAFKSCIRDRDYCWCKTDFKEEDFPHHADCTISMSWYCCIWRVSTFFFRGRRWT